MKNVHSYRPSLFNIQKVREYDQEIQHSQTATNPLHSEKEPHNIYRNNTSVKLRKRAKIRNRYNQAPHLTLDTNEKVITSQLDTTNESQDVSFFPAGDHKTPINRRRRKHNKYKTPAFSQQATTRHQ